jgi:hypothetical protein
VPTIRSSTPSLLTSPDAIRTPPENPEPNGAKHRWEEPDGAKTQTSPPTSDPLAINGTGVAIGVAVGVDVGVLVAVGVNVGVFVEVAVGVAVAVAVGVDVGVFVGVAVGVDDILTTNVPIGPATTERPPVSCTCESSMEMV